MEKLKDVDTWGAECQHYLSPEVKTMDGFVFRHLKDCGFLDYRSNRKMTSSLDFIRSCTANSELEVEMERRDRRRCFPPVIGINETVRLPEMKQEPAASDAGTLRFDQC